ncbi:MAG: HlyD family efflux transporter periplasmic adaptor subunit [Opitutae bacterium]|nr:HlyD family efflux transporter periplasmic adaptor subunit [Opitutae bacterium]
MSTATPPAPLLPVVLAQDTVESLYTEHGPQRPWIYWLALTGVIAGLGSLPWIKIDVSVSAPGMVRPATERTELRPAVSGHVAEVLTRDNDRVRAGQPLLVLRSRDLEERLARNRALQAERQSVSQDLRLLLEHPSEVRGASSPSTTGAGASSVAAQVYLRPVVDHLSPATPPLEAASAPGLTTASLRADFTQFQAQLDSYRLAETKARNELARYASLAAKGIASQQELDNARYEADRLHAELRLLVEQTRSRWAARLKDEQTALAELLSEEQRLREEQTLYTVCASAEGTLQGFTGLGIGLYLAAGQSLGTVSPDDTLLVETYVSPKDIGQIRTGQPVRLQIDAFPYTQWGLLEGRVQAVSADASIVGAGSAPVFKVIVAPVTSRLTLASGATGELGKGMTLSARFLTARRTLLQIFYQDASEWLDPQNTPPRA